MCVQSESLVTGARDRVFFFRRGASLVGVDATTWSLGDGPILARGRSAVTLKVGYHNKKKQKKRARSKKKKKKTFFFACVLRFSVFFLWNILFFLFCFINEWCNAESSTKTS